MARVSLQPARSPYLGLDSPVVEREKSILAPPHTWASSLFQLQLGTLRFPPNGGRKKKHTWVPLPKASMSDRCSTVHLGAPWTRGALGCA